MLLISKRRPAHWSIALPDLASRLRAAPAVTVAPPDDELLGSIILKQLADRQLHAGAGVVHYLVSHMERSAESARRVVAALDRRALAEGREIDRRLAADVLAGVVRDVPEGVVRRQIAGKLVLVAFPQRAALLGLCAVSLRDGNLVDGVGHCTGAHRSVPRCRERPDLLPSIVDSIDPKGGGRQADGT